MSDVLTSPLSFDAKSTKKAITFNAKRAHKGGWYKEIPLLAIAAYGGFAHDALDPDTTFGNGAQLFAEATYLFQLSDPDLLADGKLGQGTWTALLKRYDLVTAGSDYFVYKGRRWQLDRAGEVPYELREFDVPGHLDLHNGNDYTHWKKLPGREVQRILLHWGGSTAAQCRNVLFNRDLSSHFGVEPGVAHHWLDLGNKAWHASWANKNTIGIDICQQPTVANLDKYLARGLDVRKVLNPARRPNGKVVGDKVVLTLDPRTALAVRELTRDLCEMFGLPFEVPSTDGVMSKGEFKAYRGVLAHHHVAKGKWDVAPWMQQLFDPGFTYESALA